MKGKEVVESHAIAHELKLVLERYRELTAKIFSYYTDSR